MTEVEKVEALQRRVEHLEKGIREALTALKQKRYDIAESWLRSSGVE